MTRVVIGRSPAGVEWVAYHTRDVVPMRARLAALWATVTVRWRGRKQWYTRTVPFARTEVWT